MRSSRLPIWLGAVGVLLILPGVVWITASGRRFTADDASFAAQSLVRLDLDGLSSEPLLAQFSLPDTERWRKILKVWGPPDFVITALRPSGTWTWCLPDLPVRVELTNRSGTAVSLRPGGAPYMISDECKSSSLRFRAAPGDEFTLKIFKTEAGPIQAGHLIVTRDWLYTKDHLVGIDLDEDITTIVQWLAITGSLFACSAMGIVVLRHLRPRSCT